MSNEILIRALHVAELRGRLATLEAEANRWRNESAFLRETIH